MFVPRPGTVRMSNVPFSFFYSCPHINKSEAFFGFRLSGYADSIVFYLENEV
jgi:hypothetical protein